MSDDGSGENGSPSDHANKRDTERIDILGELHGEIMFFQPMAVKEISRTGAQIETTFALHVDSVHDLRLTLGDRSVVLKGRVAHSSVAEMDQELVRYRTGLEFVEAADRVYSVISEFIDAIRIGRHKG
jgi:PilZ domain